MMEVVKLESLKLAATVADKIQPSLAEAMSTL